MRSFMAWMLFASGLGFLKVVLLAKLLVPSDFGHYTSIAGAAMLTSTLLSFGLVESTIKLYPRLWIADEISAIRRHAEHVVGRLALRYAIATSIIAAAAMMVDLGYGPRTFLMGGALGLGTGLLALVASLIRAMDSTAMLQRFSVTRAVVAILAACIGGWLWRWPGAILGEAAAAAISLIGYCRVLIVCFARGAAATQLPPSHGGSKKLYFATLLSSSTSLADRGFVNVMLGPAAAGAYGVIALLFQVGQLVANILAQRIGPAVIKAVYGGDRSRAGLAAMRLPALSLLSLSILMSTALLAMKAFDLPSGMLREYGVTSTSIALGGLVAFFQIFVLLEFLLVARDHETSVLGVSTIASTLFFGLFGLAAWLGLGADWYVASALVARVVHVALLALLVRRASRRDAVPAG